MTIFWFICLGYLPFLNYLDKQSMFDFHWRSMEGKYECVVFEKDFDALTLISPSGIEKYVFDDLPIGGRP